jgi:hypothetical protein
MYCHNKVSPFSPVVFITSYWLQKLYLMALLGAGDIPLDAAREAGDDVLRHPQQGCPPRLQEVHAGPYMFFFLLISPSKAAREHFGTEPDTDLSLFVSDLPDAKKCQRFLLIIS